MVNIEFHPKKWSYFAQLLYWEKETFKESHSRAYSKIINNTLPEDISTILWAQTHNEKVPFSSDPEHDRLWCQV